MKIFHKENWYALAICILTLGSTSEKALNKMGLKKNKVCEVEKVKGNKKLYESDLENVKRMYLEEKMTMSEIGKIYKCSNCAVSEFLRKNNIETRNRGSYAKIEDKFKEGKLL